VRRPGLSGALVWRDVTSKAPESPTIRATGLRRRTPSRRTARRACPGRFRPRACPRGGAPRAALPGRSLSRARRERRQAASCLSSACHQRRQSGFGGCSGEEQPPRTTRRPDASITISVRARPAILCPLPGR
jgi:hypothetical protein